MTTRRIIAEAPGLPYRLGRHVNHDDRSRGYAVPRTTTVERSGPIWWAPNDPQPLDQDRYWDGTKYISLGSCSGNAAARAVSTYPFVHRFDEQYAVGLYSDATLIDPFPGQYPPKDTGSNGLSVMKVLKRRGIIGSYWWGFDVDQVLSGLALGPGIMGIEWREGMFEPDSRGRIKPTGAIVGGHELMFCGWDPVTQEILGPNSYGPDWGALINGCPGCYRIRIDDFAALMATGGDVCFPRAA